MSREIKFGGKRLYGINPGEWVYGGLVVAGGIHYIFDDTQSFRNADDPDFSESFREVDPETVGQFIGLKSMRGNELYVGDIIRFDHPNAIERIWVAEIVFDKDRLCFGMKRQSFARNGGILIESFSDYDEPQVDLMPFVTRIGNIHDNPKLSTPSRV